MLTYRGALVMLGDLESYPEIINIFKKEKNLRILIYGSLTLADMANYKVLPVFFDKFV